uniref:Uncharacterized protein n=1 Tax=Ostreococcus mediterraneus TaxID=1486918 RepID=A0A6U0FCY7_9CHLO|mmetsp:Transcript_7129/g.26089  ORF Transcript_7129/g.26089 Transcript_7129/m.26089 type:complete len:887 (+) Transcript_7129:46-2706(+)
MSAKHALPSRERKEFQDLVNCYETKQFKRGLKHADAVLKKFPQHGETMAMKGLVVRSMDDTFGRNEEAHALVKRGIECHPESHVCWHVYGLVHRQERNYAEAAKCYAQAAKIDPSNMLVLRDLSTMYVQMRDLKAFVEIRRRILKLKMDQRSSWFALAVGLHLIGEHAEGLSILEKYEEIRKSGAFTGRGSWRDEDKLMVKFDASELVLLKATMRRDAGQVKEALEDLEAQEANVVDKVAYLELIGACQMKLDMFDAAQKTYRKLLERLPDSYAYHRALRVAMSLPENIADGTGDISDADCEKIKALYADLRDSLKYCAAAKRLPLSFTKAGTEFTTLINAYIEKPIRKGVPSLFEDLKNLYENQDKAKLLETIFTDTVAQLKSKGTFPSGGATSSEDEKKECVMYATNLLAMHYDEMAQRSANGGAAEYAKALTLIDETIAMDGKKQPEFYLNKARFLEHAGDVQLAADVADEARKLDLADRFLNSNAVRHMMRAGRYVYAEQLAAMFARDGDQANGLFDMEATWFELEAAKCHADAGRQGRSLKYYRAVLTHFNQFVDDQFDFHGYCMRRSALRAYVDLIRVEDEMFARREFRIAARGAVRIYCNMFDDPPAKKAAALEEKIAAMPQEERRAFRQKLRKEEELAAKKEEERLAVLQRMMKEAAAKDSKNKGPKTEKKPDPDPIGAELEKTEEPLEEAMKFITPLLSHASAFEETQLLAFEVFIRQAKPILALKAVNESLKLAPESVQAKRNVARLVRYVELMPETDAMKKVMMMQATQLTDNKSAKDYAAALIGASTHPVDVAAAALAQYDVSEDKSDALLIEGVKRTVIDGVKYSHGDYVEALEAYAAASATAADAFKAACAGAFPYSCVFGGAKSTAAPMSD